MHGAPESAYNWTKFEGSKRQLEDQKSSTIANEAKKVTLPRFLRVPGIHMTFFWDGYPQLNHKKKVSSPNNGMIWRDLHFVFLAEVIC